MKVLFIGDIVGRPGRRILHSHLKPLVEQEQIDFVIANGENAAHGKGITKRVYQQLINSGVDCVTLGNHAFSKKDIVSQYQELDNLLFPVNFVNDDSYPSSKLYTIGNQQLLVSNIMGTVFMNEGVSDPFESFQKILEKYPEAWHIVDFHAEATAEKQLFARVFASQSVMIVGTHTHVQTADEQIIDGCGYITDVGMTGAYESILGRNIEEVISRHLKNKATYYQVAEGKAMLNAVICQIEEGQCIAIKRLNIKES